MDADDHSSSDEGINALTEKVIGAAFRVHNVLGTGFLEKVYENSLVHELRKLGLSAEQQVRLSVYYDGVVVGEYTADVLVQSILLIELKAGSGVENAHMAQVINYLAATKKPIFLILNFGLRVDVKRVRGRKSDA